MSKESRIARGKAHAAYKQERARIYAERAKIKWKKEIDVSKEVGKKKYTQGQKDYIKALKLIEEKIGPAASALEYKYGSDDIEELANQYYMGELNGLSPDQIKTIEEDFNKTHGYQVRIEKGSNPFAGIDFFNMEV